MIREFVTFNLVAFLLLIAAASVTAELGWVTSDAAGLHKVNAAQMWSLH